MEPSRWYSTSISLRLTRVGSGPRAGGFVAGATLFSCLLDEAEEEEKEDEFMLPTEP